MPPFPGLDSAGARVAGGPEQVMLGRYRLRRRLGAGGFGTVYEAEDERLGRLVALKVIPGMPGSTDRARREAMAAARLDHPGIVALFDAGEDDDARYLVSELVAGRTLAELEAAGELSDRDVLRIGLALADALAHAHARGVIHRDVKPQNVIVPERGGPADDGSWRAAAKLADFGVASLAGDESLTQTGDVVGTLAYMAPEQAAGERVDERVDVYALALVLYEALAGVNPVRAGSPAATARRVGTVLPPLGRHRRDLPRDVCEVIDAALAPRPDERSSLEDLAGALADALPDMPDAGGYIAPHPLERRPLRLPRGTRRAAAGLGGGALAAGALALLAPGAALEPPVTALGVSALVLLAPRLGWLAAMAGICVLVGGDASAPAGSVPLLLAAMVAVPVLLYRCPWLWSLPAGAPLLGAVLLAPAYPALAGQAATWRRRAALGALGSWWLTLAEPLLGRRLLFGLGLSDGAPDGSAVDRFAVVLAPATGAHIVLWSVAAVVLPLLVRGRSRGLDAAAAILWAAAVVIGTASIGESAGAADAYGAGGLAAGGLLAAVIAAWRR